MGNHDQGANRAGSPSPTSFWGQVHAFEADLIRSPLAANDYNVSATARALVLDRVTLLRKIARYRIPRAARRGRPRRR